MPEVLEVGATEYAFSIPAQVRGGVVTMRFTNTGSLPHEFGFGRIDPGKGLEDVRKVVESGEEPPDWMHDVAGVPALSPGRSVTVTRTLEPATYVFLCYFPSPDGTPHAQLGMFSTFEISGDTGAAPPQADLVISAGGEGLSVPEITAGEQTVELRNEGPGKHGFFILRAEDPDATFEQVFGSVEKWFEGGLAGPAPAIFVGGMQTIPAGYVRLRDDHFRGRDVHGVGRRWRRLGDRYGLVARRSVGDCAGTARREETVKATRPSTPGR